MLLRIAVCVYFMNCLAGPRHRVCAMVFFERLEPTSEDHGVPLWYHDYPRTRFLAIGVLTEHQSGGIGSRAKFARDKWSPNDELFQLLSPLLTLDANGIYKDTMAIRLPYVKKRKSNQDYKDQDGTGSEGRESFADVGHGFRFKSKKRNRVAGAGIADVGYGSRITTGNTLAKHRITVQNYGNLFGRYGPGK